MLSPDLSRAITEQLHLPLLKEKKTAIDLLRLDRIHETIAGNKWFKLRYYLEDAKQLQKNHLLTFGGAWSNHIAATAAIGNLEGFKTTGIIRGERPPEPSSTLQQAASMGMELVFTGRQEYKGKKIPAGFSAEEFYLIPEGGFGPMGANGAATILDTCTRENYTHIACAVGTGTMIAGLISASLPHQQITGIPILKNNFDLENNIRSLLKPGQNNFRLLHDYHFSGYAKKTTALLQFMNDFYRQTNIPSDFVYTGKLFFAMIDLTRENYFPPGSKILVIHSGGLQGNASLDKGTLIF